MPDPDKIILPGEEEFPQPPHILTPEGFEHRNLVRRQGQLHPENGRRPLISRPPPAPGTGQGIYSSEEVNVTRGFVMAFSMIRESDTPDVVIVSIGTFAPANYLQLLFDHSGDLAVAAGSGAGFAVATAPGFAVTSTKVPVRIALGVRMSDRHRHLLFWANGRLIKTGNNGTIAWPRSTWAGEDIIYINNGDGIRITSDIRFYAGDPAPFGGNR